MRWSFGWLMWPSVLHAAKAKGLAVAGNEFLLGGVTFRIS